MQDHYFVIQHKKALKFYMAKQCTLEEAKTEVKKSGYKLMAHVTNQIEIEAIKQGLLSQ